MAAITVKDDICENRCEYWDIWPKCIPDDDSDFNITNYGIMLRCINFSLRGKDISQI